MMFPPINYIIHTYECDIVLKLTRMQNSLNKNIFYHLPLFEIRT